MVQNLFSKIILLKFLIASSLWKGAWPFILYKLESPLYKDALWEVCLKSWDEDSLINYAVKWQCFTYFSNVSLWNFELTFKSFLPTNDIDPGLLEYKKYFYNVLEELIWMLVNIISHWTEKLFSKLKLVLWKMSNIYRQLIRKALCSSQLMGSSKKYILWQRKQHFIYLTC